MRVSDIIRRAGRGLRQAKARTLLTSLAIGVGAFTITLSLAAGAGGRQYAENLISANTDVQELRVQQKQPSGLDTSKPQEYTTGESSQSFGAGFKVKLLTQSDIDAIAHVKGVASVTPAYSLDAQYVTRPGQKKYQATVSTFNKSVKQDYLAGSVDNLSDTSVVISEGYRDVLGFSSDQAAVGTTLDLVVNQAAAPLQPGKVFTLTVAAVYKSSALTFTGSDVLQVPENVAQQLYNYNMQGTPDYGTFFAAIVRTSDVGDTASVKDAIAAKGYDVQTAQDLMSTLFTFINVLQGILLGFGALAVLTSIFGIINTQYISVLERTQQIGLMKALGMRRRDVGRLFKFEAAWIGFLGGAIGSGVAFAVGTVANPYITKALTLEEGTKLLIFSPWAIIGVVAGLMVVSVGAGILPARKAAKLDPIEALRVE